MTTSRKAYELGANATDMKTAKNQHNFQNTIKPVVDDTEMTDQTDFKTRENFTKLIS